MDYVLEVVFKSLAEVLFAKAFKTIAQLRPTSSQLAYAMASDSHFNKLNKETLLNDPNYFRSELYKLSSVNDQFKPVIEQNIKQIQTYFLQDRFVQAPLRRAKASNHLNFIILGHSQAGKTCFIKRFLYSLKEGTDFRVMMDDEEMPPELDRTERYKRYDEHLMKLAKENEDLDKGKVPGATAKKNYSFIYMDIDKLNMHFSLKFFDYAGANLDDIYKLKEVLDNEKVDGVLVVLDFYRLLADEFREIAYANNILRKEEHEKKYFELLDRNLRERVTLGEGLRTRIEYIIPEEAVNVPIAFVITKFDGFENYGLNETKAKQMLYNSLGNLLYRVINTNRHRLSVFLGTAFGDTNFIKDENEAYLIDNVHTALPALFPKGRFPFEKHQSIRRPFSFLIESHVQKRIQEAKQMLLQCQAEMSFFEKMSEYGTRIQNMLSTVDKDLMDWNGYNSTITKDHTKSNFLLLPKGHKTPEQLVKTFFEVRA